MNYSLPALLAASLVFASVSVAADPKPIKPARSAAAAATETEIKADGEATFDAENHLAMFLGGVTVSDTRFTMKSQKLTVYLSKSTQPNVKDDPAGGGIERAVAEGGVEIIQIPAPGTDDAQRVTGRAERVSFEPKTGVVVLSGSPVVRRGPNEHIATAASTTMTLTREGGLRTNGPSKTIIRDTGKAAELTATTNKKP